MMTVTLSIGYNKTRKGRSLEVSDKEYVKLKKMGVVCTAKKVTPKKTVKKEEKSDD